MVAENSENIGAGLTYGDTEWVGFRLLELAEIMNICNGMSEKISPSISL